jgi:CBS domain-containing protein
MKISDILERKGNTVIAVAPDATVTELLATLAEHRIGAAVVANGNDVVGIVSERDVVRRLHDRGAELLTGTVREIMTRDVLACTPDDDLDAIAETMTQRRVRHMPVIADGRIHGVISIGDVVKSRMDSLEQERGHLEHYITG